MFTIALEDIQFHAYHGYYPEEHILGNKYLVSVYVELPEKQYINGDMGSTLNYESIFKVLKKIMEAQYDLLETVAIRIHEEIIKIDNRIHSVNVIIKKINPLIHGMQGNSVVQLKRNYDA